MTASGPDDHHEPDEPDEHEPAQEGQSEQSEQADQPEEPEPQRRGPDLDEERRLLIEALTQAFAPAGGASAREPGCPAQTPHGSQPGSGDGSAHPGDRSARQPGDGSGQPGDGSARQPADGPMRGTGPATDSCAGPAEAGGDDPAAGSDPAVGCACCGCRAPRACAVCPFCRGTAAALDPHVLERVADVATLLAEGLRAAAHRLSTEERDER